MKHSVANGEATSLAALTRSPDYGARVIDILPVIGDADSTESVVALFRAAVTGLGADAGVFMSYLRDDATVVPIPVGLRSGMGIGVRTARLVRTRPLVAPRHP